MTQELLEEALPRLRRALGLEAGADDSALEDALAAAEEQILRYLNREELPGRTGSLVVELAALKYRRGRSGEGVQEESYAEGQLSQSVRYLTGEDYAASERELLSALAPLRQVACKGAAE